jgi:hypothetical protein
MIRHFPDKSTKLIRIVGGKGLVIPEGGWNSESFARHGQAMILALAHVAKITQRREAAILAKRCNEMFRRQVQEINRRVIKWSRSKAPKPTVVELDLPQNAHLWTEAMNEVFAEAGIDAVATVMPSVQKVMALGYSRTSILLGQEPDDVSRLVTIKSRAIAQRITNISNTTRDRIMTVVKDSLERGFSVVDTAAAIESAAPQIYGNRSLTIARTEMNNAWTEMAVTAMQESSTVTEVSVIGCEAREPNSPTYRGESTCNIQGVPIQDADSLEFHINHTGNIVPSGFRNEDGTNDSQADKPPILDEWARISAQQEDGSA